MEKLRGKADTKRYFSFGMGKAARDKARNYLDVVRASTIVRRRHTLGKNSITPASRAGLMKYCGTRFYGNNKDANSARPSTRLKLS